MFELFGKRFYTEKDIAALTGKTDLQVDLDTDEQYLRDMVKSDQVTIKQQAREIEQLTEQLDALRQQQATTTPTDIFEEYKQASREGRLVYTNDPPPRTIPPETKPKRKSRTTGAKP